MIERHIVPVLRSTVTICRVVNLLTIRLKRAIYLYRYLPRYPTCLFPSTKMRLLLCPIVFFRKEMQARDVRVFVIFSSYQDER